MGSYTLLLLVGYSHAQAQMEDDQVDRLIATPEGERECIEATDRVNTALNNYQREELLMALMGPNQFSVQKYKDAMVFVKATRDYADALENYLKVLARVYHGYVEP